MNNKIAIVFTVILTAALSQVAGEDAVFIGVNIGTQLSDMPNPNQVVALLKAQQIKHVRLYDADHAMLVALANSGIQVTISLPTDEIIGVGQSNSTAANWVAQNVLAYYPATKITSIAIGSEIFSSLPNADSVLLKAAQFIQSALVASNVAMNIKVSSPLSSSIILDSFPPSQAFFNKSLTSVLIPFLSFLQSTESFLMLNIYPYYDYIQSNGAIPLDYALFKPLPANKQVVDANTNLYYSNVFDTIVDAAYFAMTSLNFTNIPVVVTESGWPSKGDSSEIDATVDNANMYNSNLIMHVLSKKGTPKHPGIGVSTYIYELYNEDLKPGPISAQNWGLFDANGEPIYVLHFTDAGSVFVNDTSHQTYCIARKEADESMLQAALDWACGAGKVDCTSLWHGKPCYEPDTVQAHASYAFNEYYQRTNMATGTCDFNGVGTITTSNPSHGNCVFSGSSEKLNGTFGNITEPSLNGTSLLHSSSPTMLGRASTSSMILLRIIVLVIAHL